ncbi:DUF6084 family protein [soil metagenome]
MSELTFELINAKTDRFAAAPTIVVKLKITDLAGEPIHAMTLQCQVRIEVQRRQYSAIEADRLHDLFGETARWGETLKPLHFTTLSIVVPGFTGSTEIDVPIPCTYDFDVSCAKYFHALDDGEIPLIFLFSGSVFSNGTSGFSVARVPWDCEASYRLPVSIWREMMDQHFPNSAWIRVQRDTLDALQRFKSHQAMTSWDQALESLLGVKGESL